MEEGKGKYESQKKYLSNQKQLRVWMSAEKFALLKEAAAKNKDTIYGLVNRWVDEYLKQEAGE